MSRYCASCGTEVDDTAIFCPTCGQPIDQDVETAIPPAPAWPDPSTEGGAPDVGHGEATRPMDVPSEPPARTGWEPEPPAAARDEPPPARPAPDRHDPEPIRPVSERRYEPEPEPEPPPARRPEPAAMPFEVDASPRGEWERRDQPGPGETTPPPAAPAPPRARATPPHVDPTRQPSGPGTPAAAPSSPLSNLPVTAPVTLSGWLVGIGATIGAVGALISLFDGFGAAVDLLLLVALAAVALSVFFSTALPAFSWLRLATLAIILVAFGAAMDRLLTGAAGAGELLLFLGTAAAVIGAFLLELGRDQPLGGP